MMTCRRCGASTPRVFPTQRYCPDCSHAVSQIIAADERRRTRVVWRAGDTTPWSGRAA